MEITATDQFIIFLYSILCGIMLGLIFDIFKIVRRVTKPSIMLTGVQDIVYWILSSAVVFVYLFVYNSGEMRLFAFVGIFASGLVYSITLSRLVVNTGVWLYNAVAKAVMCILKVVLTPIVWLYKLLKKPFFIVVNATGRGARRYKKARISVFDKMSKSFKNFYKIFKKI